MVCPNMPEAAGGRLFEVDKFGRIDILVNNASALWWQRSPEPPTEPAKSVVGRIEDTPMNKYDLITQINSPGPEILKPAEGRTFQTCLRARIFSVRAYYPFSCPLSES